MSITIEAIYESGILKPLAPLPNGLASILPAVFPRGFALPQAHSRLMDTKSRCR
jgi:Protein of unknown function DUF104